MGRLIDADRLNKDFSLIITHIENSNKETISKEEFCKCLKILRECVNEQPTAYDEEKVVAELEREKELHTEHYNNSIYKDFPDVKQRYKQIQLVLDKAIEIVIKGRCRT